MLRLLLKAGIVRRNNDGSLRWPVSISPWHIWSTMLRCAWQRKDWLGSNPWFGVFRNDPRFIRDVGTWLPRRWGFYVFGLEVGQRG